MPRDFNQVRRDMQEVVLLLKDAPDDMKLRRKLLKLLRLLLEEADYLISQDDLLNNSN
jgi:DNA-binding winged helix-turn-helix (wHTH) protein